MLKAISKETSKNISGFKKAAPLFLVAAFFMSVKKIFKTDQKECIYICMIDKHYPTIMGKNFVEELKWRGMIHDIMPGTEEQLEKEMTSAYVGIDPTADSLHIGHLVGVMMLKHFQNSGHKPIVLIGGATGMIGDPSGKSQERNLLDEKTLRHNQDCLKTNWQNCSILRQMLKTKRN